MTKGWLKDLEEKVRDTSEALRSLREENETLKAKVSELETRLEKVRSGSMGTEETEDTGGGGQAWQQERDEIRQRVETLVDHLSSLLSEG